MTIFSRRSRRGEFRQSWRRSIRAHSPSVTSVTSGLTNNHHIIPTWLGFSFGVVYRGDAHKNTSIPRGQLISIFTPQRLLHGISCRGRRRSGCRVHSLCDRQRNGGDVYRRHYGLCMDIQHLSVMRKKYVRTRVVSANSGFHDRFHPFAHNQLFLRAETVRLISLVDNPETITARIDFLVRYNLVASDIDITLDFRLLQCRL